MADRQTLAWGVLAWEDPLKINGPVSPFWGEVPMLDGKWATEAPPLAGIVVNADARLSGLRLADGTLILKIENRSEAAQVRIGPETGSDSGRQRRSHGSRISSAWREA